MRGDEQRQAGFIVMTTLEDVVPGDHPLRAIRTMVDAALAAMSPELEALYASGGRPSIAPEYLLRAQLIQILAAIRSQAEAHKLLSREHFSVDGTLIEAAAALKSLRPLGEDEGEEPPPSGGGRNPDVDFHGQCRGNLSHRSTTDPEARLARKGNGKEAKLCYAGHTLTENRNGLIVECELTQDTGTAEREA